MMKVFEWYSKIFLPVAALWHSLKKNQHPRLLAVFCSNSVFAILLSDVLSLP